MARPEKLDHQIAAINRRAKWLAWKLKKDLEDANSFTETVPKVQQYIISVNDEFGAYVKVVNESEGNPGDPCGAGEIWCIPLRRCARADDCEKQNPEASD